MGASRRPEVRALRGPQGPRPLRPRSRRGRDLAARGPARARDGRVGGVRAHEGHGPRERGRDRLLDGVGRAEGRPRGRRLPRRDRALGADRAPRDDRPAHARRDDHRARAAREAAPVDPRREDESVGHHGAVRRDPRREDSGRARGRDVAPGAGRARAPGPHHPRHSGDRDRRAVRRPRATPTRTIRSPCTSAP